MAEFKGKKLIELVGELSRHPTAQTVTWVPLATFRQIPVRISSKETKTDVKILLLGQKGGTYEFAKENAVAHQINTFLKNEVPCTRTIRKKMASGHHKKFQDPTHHNIKHVKKQIPLKDCFKKTAPDHSDSL